MNSGSALSPRPAIDHIRKPQILRAAADVITERGLAGTRIADIAARAGTSAPAVIYWFETRDQLLTAALTADEVQFAEMIEGRIASLPDASSKLLAILESTASEVDLSLWIELWARALHDEASGAERRRLDVAWRELIARVVADGQAGGEFAAEADPAAFAVEIAALLDGFSVQVTLGDADVPQERMLEASVAYADLRLGTDLRAAGAELEGAA